MVIAAAVEVYCSNKSCPHLVHNGRPRFIGDYLGTYTRQQCRVCGKFTVRGSLPSGGDVT